jgi:hypothetical protein
LVLIFEVEFPSLALEKVGEITCGRSEEGLNCVECIPRRKDSPGGPRIWDIDILLYFLYNPYSTNASPNVDKIAYDFEPSDETRVRRRSTCTRKLLRWSKLMAKR